MSGATITEANAAAIEASRRKRAAESRARIARLAEDVEKLAEERASRCEVEKQLARPWEYIRRDLRSAGRRDLIARFPRDGRIAAVKAPGASPYTQVQRALIDDVRFLLRYSPADAATISSRLGKSLESFERELREVGRADLLARMAAERVSRRGGWQCGSPSCARCGPGATARRRAS